MKDDKTIPSISPEYAHRVRQRKQSNDPIIWSLLDDVCDPELPGLSLWNLGVLVNVERQSEVDEQFVIKITPTYSGCPAIETMKTDIEITMKKAGYKNTLVKVVLSPAWNTEMISPEGKCQLKKLSIAPPNTDDVVYCPVCGSDKTKPISQFGSTACKALYQCSKCFESFDYFKNFN